MEQDMHTNTNKDESSKEEKKYIFSSPEDIINHPEAPKRLVDFWMALQKAHKFQKPSIGTYPDISAIPWHSSSDFPWVSILNENYQKMRDEYLQLVEEKFKFSKIQSNVNETGEWSTVYFINQGRKDIQNCKRCPITTSILEQVNALTTNTGLGYAYFSILTPGTRISRHCGPTNFRLRCHLPLIVPKTDSPIEESAKNIWQEREGKCEMRVDLEVRPWIEGQAVVFDDSFEHEVWNLSEETRVVLLIDVWHPDLTSFEIQALQFLFP